MASRAYLNGELGLSPWGSFVGSDLLPSGASASTEIEYSLADPSMGVGRWSAGWGAELLELRGRHLAAEKSALAERLIANHQYSIALALCRDACRADPEQPRFQFLAGIAAWNAGADNEAGRYLHEAVRLAPADVRHRQVLADWCLDHGDYPAAMQQSGIAIELQPNDPPTMVCRASILEAHGKTADAWELAQRLLRSDYGSPKLAALSARLAPRTGHEEAALHEIRQWICMGGLVPSDHRMLHLAAASLLDRLGRFDEAFAAARAGHSAAVGSYDPSAIEQMVQAQIDYFTPAKLHSLPRALHGNRRPVFIIGMPRSGTSLVEQILASHPDVFGAGELKALSDLLPAMGGAKQGADGFPRCLDDLSARAVEQHASHYLNAIENLNHSASFVTDKMPTNFLLVGVIAMLFPDAHVIHCTRNAMDTCLSCYLTDFLFGYELSRSLTHVGGYYRQYRRLMQHWTKTLNFPMLEVRYESVVADQPGQARRMLDFLGLPWDDRCAAFHKTARHVATSSGNQVNQPIYSRSVGRWMNYEKHLAPLQAALGEWCD